MEQTSEARIVYRPQGDATSETGLYALVSIYRFLLFEKGDRHDLTTEAATGAEGVNDKKGQDSNVRR